MCRACDIEHPGVRCHKAATMWIQCSQYFTLNIHTRQKRVAFMSVCFTDKNFNESNLDEHYVKFIMDMEAAQMYSEKLKLWPCSPWSIITLDWKTKTFSVQHEGCQNLVWKFSWAQGWVWHFTTSFIEADTGSHINETQGGVWGQLNTQYSQGLHCHYC